ncbi:uncharacterized protein SOCE26_049990 [Sorangium cellulosum]|uniref:Sulfatase N-terminal domain-containing protein n=1 Tax=Sorangium cellulosum TaxID=56 RepID=A0A2L0EWB0_SORCE|nr:sulfatase-like hydrolase/transferase [Sorangium cellulosum]AUX43549.1 uncharacterized protein SOCE26_049990 [Sorangium cellulosum]
MAKPNILIILADDLGVDVLRINAGAKTVSAQVNSKNGVAGPVTLPTFGRLLKAGVHFENAWAQPVCTPTRASLWTGVQPWKTGLGFPSGGDDNLVSQTVTGQNVQTLAQSMVGYKCAMFGKWDLGTRKTPVEWGWHTFAGIFRGGVRPDGITQYGFDPKGPSQVDFARLKNPTDSTERAKCEAAARALAAKYDATFLNNNPDLRNYIWEKDTVGADGKAKPPLGPADRKHIYITEDQVEDAKRWILANQGPWCVALNLVAPHDPWHLPPPHTFKATTIKDPTKPTIQEMLVAMVESIDYYVNDLLTAISGQLANTVVIFVCDNGTQDFDPDARSVSIDEEIGDDKATSSIGGVHVPMIVADGGLMMGGAPCYVKTAPRSVRAPVHIIDVYNTAVEIAGLSPNPALDSISFVPHLDESVRKPTRTHNFSQLFVKPGPGVNAPRVGATVSDTASQYKLTCDLLVNASGVPVDRSSQPTTAIVLDYKFSCLVPDPKIPGSLKQKPIDALAPNPDGSYTVTDLAYQDKLIELHGVLARERPYDDPKSSFPAIRKSLFVFPPAFLDKPVLIENVESKRYLFSDGPALSRERGAEGGWGPSPNVVGADANYYNRALWIIRKAGECYLIENLETKRYLFSTGHPLSGPRGAEGGWLASSGFESPKLVGADANYYNMALWVFQPQGSAFLIANYETKRYAFSDGPALSRERGAEGGWLASSGFESPKAVGADANYYNRALWVIKQP